MKRKKILMIKKTHRVTNIAFEGFFLCVHPKTQMLRDKCGGKVATSVGLGGFCVEEFAEVE